MNAVQPLTYHVVKAEEAHRLARLERRAMAKSAQQTDNGHVAHAHHLPDVFRIQRRAMFPRAVGAAIATGALLLAMVGGAALAEEQGSNGGGGGGSARVSLE